MKALVFGAALGLATLVGAAQAMPVGPVAAGDDAALTLVAGGCGPGFHRGPWGGCRPNFGPRRFYGPRPFYGPGRFAGPRCIVRRGPWGGVRRVCRW